MDVKNVPVEPVMPRDLIYSYSVTGASLSTLYERGRDVFVYDGDVLSLCDGARPAPGHYRTCNRHGLVQMGAYPVGPLTATVSLPSHVQGVVEAPTDATLHREVMQQSGLLAASA